MRGNPSLRNGKERERLCKEISEHERNVEVDHHGSALELSNLYFGGSFNKVGETSITIQCILFSVKVVRKSSRKCVVESAKFDKI